MAKLTLEADEARLKKKVAGPRTEAPKGSKGAKPDGETAGRRLRKHLKRLQRKRRRLALRKQHAQGKQQAAPSQPATAAPSAAPAQPAAAAG
jgi:hypothetical protein